ncbi:hypothetical protein MPTK1_7g17460 [Marchantia polymorpha subsp. ruderalis]|uniref:Uncharacterized protein n=2 Tax=Marchantia polymorpha TaxID=3197 RepID=A0AAF6C0S3_MARPO|nr:hypothetical protein MARPO_0051s0083 [Marchantia polymorpha]BBN17857.1 hypothetical protein Mp_7g17460 [Marchantia polymorpha subsp. ruderalis]|eukprot:PTQ38482.1 hypothetical protein MARPO_0051s0083 [Marchantia polymorpha]
MSAGGPPRPPPHTRVVPTGGNPLSPVRPASFLCPDSEQSAESVTRTGPSHPPSDIQWWSPARNCPAPGIASHTLASDPRTCAVTNSRSSRQPTDTLLSICPDTQTKTNPSIHHPVYAYTVRDVHTHTSVLCRLPFTAGSSFIAPP